MRTDSPPGTRKRSRRGAERTANAHIGASEERMETRRVVVHGRVQGVGFRWFVVRNAEALGIGGTVRNRPDGAVEAILSSAEAADVESLIQRIQQGPPGARVDRVEVDPIEGLEGERGTMKVIR